MRLLALILIIGVTGDALAFRAGGHRIIAEIAWQQLDENRRAELAQLLKHHPRLQQDFIDKMPDSVGNGTQEMKDHWLFLQASVWSDLARGFRNPDRGKYHRGTWHYINFPTYIDASHESVIDLSGVNRNTEFKGAFRDDPDFNIVQAIKANLAGLRDTTRTKAERAVHLCWVLHLVGDAHQPLHATAMFTPRLFAKGDLGAT